jgi:2-C-methyl-D-erythritol 4-phosphate cytidylyltransferase
MENIGINVECVTTSKNNIKITTPEDIALAEFIISAQRDK